MVTKYLFSAFTTHWIKKAQSSKPLRIVHPKNKAQGHPRCRWLCFFSRTQTKFFLTQPLQSVSHIMTVNGTHGFERKKNIHRQNQIKPCGLWQYIEVQLSWARSQKPARDASSSSCFTADRRLISALPPPISQMDHWHYLQSQLGVNAGGSEVKKNNINTVQFLAQTDCFVSMYRHEPQGLIWFCLCMVFFSLKAMSPIDCHYMTDRLKRFELKNLRLCSTEETKSPTSWMPLG